MSTNNADAKKYTQIIKEYDTKIQQITRKMAFETRLYDTHTSKMDSEKKRCTKYFENTTLWREHAELTQMIQQKKVLCTSHSISSFCRVVPTLLRLYSADIKNTSGKCRYY
jgi:hypothetical protein